MAMVELKGVTKNYALGKVQVTALNEISLEIQKGDFVSIAGPSGSGKTTILNLIGCIDRPSTGEVLVDGQLTSALKDDKLTELRHRTLGFIFQNFNLIPVLSVFENVEFPLLLGPTPVEAKNRKAWIEHILERVGLADRMKHRPNELSGGQRQRVAIARALVTKPQIVLADEPTANLDSGTSIKIIELMKSINDQEDTTFIFSTHDQRIVDIVDHVIRLEDGRIVSQTSKATLQPAGV